MRTLIHAAMFAALAIACSGETPSQPANAQGGVMPTAQAQSIKHVALPSGVVRVQSVDVVDAQGFERPLVAYKLLIPAGWRTEGGVQWNIQDRCIESDYYLNWKAISPDGVSVLAVVPQPLWRIVRSSYPIDPDPCATAQWTNVRDYLHDLARRTSPQGRVLDFRLRPDLAKPLNDMIKLFPSLNTAHLQSRQYHEVGEILIASTLNGREMRETIRASVHFAQVRMADILNPGQIAMETMQGTPTFVTFVRAPAGELNLKLPDVFDKSVVQMREWSDRIYAHNREKQKRKFEAIIASGKHSQEQLRQMNEAHNARMEAAQATKAYNDRLYDQRNAISDRGQREFVESIRGVETYHEPVEGGAVQLDNSFDHAWRLRDGSYLLTQDPNFRPGLIGLEGQELQRVQ